MSGIRTVLTYVASETGAEKMKGERKNSADSAGRAATAASQRIATGTPPGPIRARPAWRSLMATAVLRALAITFVSAADSPAPGTPSAALLRLQEAVAVALHSWSS